MISLVELHTALVSHFASFAASNNIPFQYGEKIDNKGHDRWMELLVEGPVFTDDDECYYACRLICATRERDVYAPQRLLDTGRKALVSIPVADGCLYVDLDYDITVENFMSTNKVDQLKEPSLVFFYRYEGD